MQITDYKLDELHFAYCYHAFLHWRTHRRRPYPDLSNLDQKTLHGLVEPYGIHAYLDAQSEHHGYHKRERPPVFAATYQPDEQPQPWWHAEHAFTHMQFHLVLATAMRRGLFGPQEGAAVAERWLELQGEKRLALRKVSFLPDHVHIAVLLHPAVSPASVALAFMNEGQRLLAEKFSKELIGRGLSRVWQPSAYVGSYGELATAQIQKYIERWRAQA